jgi:ParB family chromosome partitioning protein
MVASIVGQKLSVRDIETMTKSMKSSSPAAPAKAEKESFDLSELTDRFKDLGFRVKTKPNEITISFDSDETIEKLLNRL